MLGGLPQYSSDPKCFNSSISYYQDDYTWCVQRAKFLPLVISVVRIATPTVWLLVVGLGYVNGLILYFFVQFDPKPQNRKLDLHYTTYLISLPAWIGFSQRFMPKHCPLRIYYIITVVYGMILFAFCLTFLLEYGEKKIRSYQVHEIRELIDMNFRFTGTGLVLDYMRKQQLVGFAFILLHLMI